MYSRCPGSEGRNLNVEIFKCPGCGSDVEIFSDEMRFRCKKCGTMVVRGEVASACLDWCEAAGRMIFAAKSTEAEKSESNEKESEK